MSDVLFSKAGAVATISINRPQTHNIMSANVFLELKQAWQKVREDSDIRVAVLTAAGDKDFCCGGDLSDVIPLWTGKRQAQTPAEQALVANPMILDDVMLKSEPLYKPVISAINGRALGGGFEIMLATDIRIASSDAQFGVPEPKSGIIPGAGTMARLARQISYAHAMKLLLTAEPIDAEEAARIGLINEVVANDELLARAYQIAETLAGNAPLALQAIKRTVIDSHTETWARAYEIEMEQSAGVMMSKDAREGPRAFKEKRKPEFKGE